MSLCLPRTRANLAYMVGSMPSTVRHLHRGGEERLGVSLVSDVSESWKVIRPHYHSGCDANYLCEFVLHLWQSRSTTGECWILSALGVLVFVYSWFNSTQLKRMVHI